jgi:Domain of unknown function (DUF4304)
MTEADAKGVGARFLDALQERLGPMLKKSGFKKSGRCYFRVHNGRRYDVIELRASIYGSADSSRFTVEVYQHDAHKDDPHARRWKKFPTTGSNIFNRNIGGFLPSGHQHWWDLSESTNEEALCDELAGLMEAQVIPYFGEWGPTNRPFIVPAW